MVGGEPIVMAEVILRLNAASSPSSFGLELQPLLMANPGIQFSVIRKGEYVEVIQHEHDDG